MSALRFGVFLPQLRMTFSEIDEKVSAAEALGYDSVWFMDHLAAPGMPETDCLEAWTLASALAVRTERIRIGHLVLCNEFRHPALLAKMAATLDHISGGRLDLGLGWGSVPDEFDAFGIGYAPARVRAGRLKETLEVLKLLFTGERVSYKGDYFSLDGAVANPRPVQDPLPIHLGGAGEKLTLPLVAEHATWWNCPSYGIDRLAELRPLAGNARVSAQHPVGLVRSESERATVEQQARRRFGAWGGLIVGDAEEVAAALSREVALGVELFVLQFHDFGDPASLEAFARDVIPLVTSVSD
jgi:alkanesulfonate monooxygenase SsuD/methylene tetrahydromethanopterin reductase-like flavin-dependent oxidoreductase (luciferase family)